jgi:hypothetical protein
MTHSHDTHVLIDEHGVAVLSGTEREMTDELVALKALGHERVAVRPIDEAGNWAWELVDWGD